MAPIRWTGSTSSGGTSFSSGDGSTSLGLTNSLSVQARSFIVAPYIGQWSGGFGRSSSNSSVSSATSPTIKGEGASNNLGGGVTLLPSSDFPFSAQFSHSWSDSKTAQAQGSGSATAITLQQKYRSPDGRDNYSASYARGVASNDKERSVSSSMSGDFSTRREFDEGHYLEGTHLLSAGVSFTPGTVSLAGASERKLNTSVSHDWRVHEDLNFSNRLAMNSSKIVALQGNSLSSNDSTVLLGSTTFNWRPFEEEPLLLVGGASFGRTQSKTGTDLSSASAQNFPGISQQSFSANVTGTYTFNKNLSAGAGASMVASSSDGTRYNSATASANVGYTGDALQLGAFNYGWNVGGGVNASHTSPGKSFVGVSTTAGHNLYRTIAIDERQAVTLNAGQGLSLATLSEQGAVATLSNSLGANWSASYGDSLTTNLAANANYTTGTGIGNKNSLGLNLSGGGRYMYQVSSRSAATVDANINWTRSSFGGGKSQELNQIIVDSQQSQLNGIVTVGYNHSSPFAIRNLSYNANLFWFVSQSGTRIAGSDPQANKIQTTTTLQQNLRYRVGRLSFNANAAVINSRSKTSYSLFGSVTREFDGFFDGRW